MFERFKHGITAYVDPGKHLSAVAWAQPDRLLEVQYAANGSLNVAWRADRIVGERPVVYPGKGGFAADLIDVAIGLGITVKSLGGPQTTTRYWRPAEWKSSVKKAVMTARIEAHLSDEERVMVEKSAPKSLRHNVLDAVGMWLYDVGRL